MNTLAMLAGAAVAVAVIAPKLSSRTASASLPASKEWRPVVEAAGVSLDYQPQTGGTVTRYQIPAKGQQWADEFRFAEMFNDLPDGLLARMAQQESNFNPYAVSPAGAVGLMQFMPATWKEWGLGYDINDPVAQIRAAGRYMAWLFEHTGNWPDAVAAYNFGIGNIWKGRAWPTETVNYVANISKDIDLDAV